MLVEKWNKFTQREKINVKLQNRVSTFYNSQNYLEQLCHVCEDIDNILKKNLLTKEDIIALITYTSWSFEAVDNIKHELENIFNITLTPSNQYNLYNQFHKAIRSFIIAHPLSTNQKRHAPWNLDGNYVCLDVYYNFPKYLMNVSKKYFSINGVKDKARTNKRYVYLKVYNTKLKGQDPSFQKYFGLCIEDLINCVEQCLKELDSFNKTLKKEIR